jgi:hypothetical protein
VSTALIVIPTVCYLGVAFNEAISKNWSGAIVFADYSVANLGFIMGLAK